MTMMLYEISEQYRSLLSLAEREDLPPDVIRDTLDGLEGLFEDKAVAVSHMILNLESSANAIVDRAGAMLARGNRMAERAEQLRAYLMLHMQVIDRKRIEHEDFTIRRQNNPPSVVIDDETVVPSEYKVKPPAPPERIDKQAIGIALAAGKDVPGAHVYKGEHLRIQI